MNRSDLGRKLARVATNAALRSPFLWRLFRPLVRRMFDAIAPSWDQMRMEDTFAPFEVALAAVEPKPRKVLDLGTGTGEGAFVLARQLPDAEIVVLSKNDRSVPDPGENTVTQFSVVGRSGRSCTAHLNRFMVKAAVRCESAHQENEN